MIQEIKIKELSETEELSNEYSFFIPERFLEKLEWSNEYCIKVTLDEEHNQLVITQSDIKVKHNLKPLISKEQYYIIEEVENNKTFTEIAKQLNSKVGTVKFQYEIACGILEDYLTGYSKKHQLGMPKNFVIPSYIIEEAEKRKKESENNKIKKILSEKHAFVLNQRASRKNYTEIGKELNLSSSAVRELFYRSCRYIKDYLRGQINLEMPNDFVITEEIKEAVKQRLNIEKL